MNTLLIALFVGLVAGWLASVIVRGRGYGIVADIIIGLVGSFIGGLIYELTGLSPTYGILGSIVMSTIGAIVLLVLLSAFRTTDNTMTTA